MGRAAVRRSTTDPALTDAAESLSRTFEKPLVGRQTRSGRLGTWKHEGAGLARSGGADATSLVTAGRLLSRSATGRSCLASASLLASGAGCCWAT
jgi:hypothetical protein